MNYTLYNNDIPVANFKYERCHMMAFQPLAPELLPKQIYDDADHYQFAYWIKCRAINLDQYLHRALMKQLYGTGDALEIAIASNMYSVSDTFTCFPEGEFISRAQLCDIDKHTLISSFIIESAPKHQKHKKTNVFAPNMV